jgi:hypothetical protein
LKKCVEDKMATTITTQQEEDAKSPPKASTPLVQLYEYGKIVVKENGDQWDKGESQQPHSKEYNSGTIAGEKIHLDVMSHETLQDINGVGERTVTCRWDPPSPNLGNVKEIKLIAHAEIHGRLTASVLGGKITSLSANAKSDITVTIFGEASSLEASVEVKGDKVTITKTLSGEASASGTDKASVHAKKGEGGPEADGGGEASRDVSGKASASMKWETVKEPSETPSSDTAVDVTGDDTDIVGPGHLTSKSFTVTCNGNAMGTGNKQAESRASLDVAPSWKFGAVVTLTNGESTPYGYQPKKPPSGAASKSKNEETPKKKGTD